MRIDKEYSQAVTQAKENLVDLNERGADAGGCSLGDGKQIKIPQFTFEPYYAILS